MNSSVFKRAREWPAVRVGDYYQSWGGGTPAKDNAAYWGPGTPWLSSKDVKGDFVGAGTLEVTPQALSDKGLRTCPAGSVVIVVRSGVLARTVPLARTTQEVVINQDLKAFYSSEPLMNEWLYFYLRYKTRDILLNARRDGTTVQSIRYPLLKSLEFPLPDRSEREVVVNLIRHFMERTTVAEKATDAATAALVSTDRRLLSAACRGRLTADWRNASSVYSIEASDHEPKLPESVELPGAEDVNNDAPVQWKRVRLGDICQVKSGTTPARSRTDFFGGDVPWIASGAVNQGLIVEPSEYVTELALEETSLRLMPRGSLVVALYGEGQTRGRVAELGISTTTNQALATISFPPGAEQHKDFIRLFLENNYYRMRQLALGGVQSNLSGKIIKDVVIALPHPDEQQEIVRRTGAARRRGDAAFVQVKEAREKLDAAEQSFLRSCFAAS